MPAFVDAVEYGKFGEATVTATLFGGMDPSLYADFKKGVSGQMAVTDANLKHSEGWVSHSHMAIKASLLDVTKQDKEVPLGSSGIQIRMKVDLVVEGFRPGRIVRIRPMNWPDDAVPREEYTEGHLEERFPSPWGNPHRLPNHHRRQFGKSSEPLVGRRDFRPPHALIFFPLNPDP